MDTRSDPTGFSVKDADDVGAAAILKICSQETLEDTAKNLARLHRPAKVDFKARFGIRNQTKPTYQPEKTSQAGQSIVCGACSSTVSENIVQYCLDRKHQFKGRILCYSCQRSLSAL